MDETTWQKETTVPTYPSLPGDATADVCIIGAGMTGTLAAYFLAKAGKSVIVIDKNKNIETSATVCTTAFLVCDIDTALTDLVSMFGVEQAHDIWHSGEDAIDAIENIIKEEHIECEYMRTPEHWYATSGDGWKAFQEEAREARKAGFAVEDVQPRTYPKNITGIMALRNQAKFHPLKFLTAVRKAAESLGAHFYSLTEATGIEGDLPVSVQTDKGTITATYAIVATYLSIENPPSIFGKKGMYTSYVYELSVPSGAVPEGLYLDDQNPYHYFRIDKGLGKNGDDRMILGGEDAREELPEIKDRQFSALSTYIEKYFPNMPYQIISSWTGAILETFDGLPYIGQPSHERPHHLVATGFSGNGMTYAMTAAGILTDIVEGRENKYEKLFSPYREVTIQGTLYKIRDYAGEFIHGYLQNIFSKKE